MQLKNHHPSIRPALAGACATLLGTAAQAAPLGGAIFQPSQEQGAKAPGPGLAAQPRYPHFLSDSRAQASSLLYKETDGRILVWENTLSATHFLDEDHSITLTGTTDLITGASPVGTVPSNTPQIITGASGQITTIPPQELPLFAVSDLRLALSGGYRYPLRGEFTGQTTLSAANERDFRSLGIAQALVHGRSHSLTTWQLGLAGELDEIRPIGGVPPTLAPEGSFTLQGGEEDDDLPGKPRLSLEWQAGVSQVLSRRLLLQGQYFGGHLRGYLTDPYKRLSYVSAISGDPLPAQGTWTERRPDRRTYHGLTLALLTALPHGRVWRNEVRVFRDDWQIQAAALDTRLDLPLTGEPDRGIRLHARLYRQSAAWFYHYRLLDGPATTLPGARPEDVTSNPANLPAASADWRLGSLDDLFIDVGYRHALSSMFWRDGQLRARVGHLVQRDRRALFPTLHAWYVQLDIDLAW